MSQEQKANLADYAEKPDLARALQYQDENSLRQIIDGEYRPFPYICTHITAFSSFGIGLQLYFHFVKSLAVLFLLISLISVWPMVVHSEGNGIKEDLDQEHAYGAVSIANEDEESVSDNKPQIIAADLTYTGLFILFLLYYRISAGRIVQKSEHETHKISNYAIAAKRLPNECSEEEVRIHFQQFGAVTQVHLARIYNDKLYDYHKRTQLTYSLGAAFLKAKAKGKASSNTIKMLQLRIKQFDQRIRKKEQKDLRPYDQLPVDRAYVVFETIEDRNNCIKQYNKARKWWRSAHKQRTELQFGGKSPLHVKAAPEPSIILWENLELTLCKKLVRSVIIALVTLAILIGTIALLFWLKGRESNLPTALECKSDGFTSTTPYNSTYTSEYEVNCYCLTRPLSKIIDGEPVCKEPGCEKLDDYCADFLDAWTVALYTKIITSVGIIFINFFLLIALKLLTAIERPPTLDKLKLSLLNKVFLAMFINTTIITVLVNADFQDYISAYGLFDGKYTDLTQGWYLSVGSTLVVTLFINVFSPHCVNLLVLRSIRRCLRCCCWRRAKTQQELNGLFVGPEFDLAVKYAVVLNLVFSCFLYSGGMPLLNCFCFLGLFFIYWTDKYLILRYYKKPPVYNETLNTRAITLLPLSVIFHCAVSLYMYGADGEMLPEDTPLGERIVSASGLLLILYMLIAVGMGFFAWIVVEIYHCIRRIPRKSSKWQTYTEVIEEIRKNTLASYDIRDNETYAPLIHAMKSVFERSQTMQEPLTLDNPAPAPHSEDSNPQIVVEDELKPSEPDIPISDRESVADIPNVPN